MAIKKPILVFVCIYSAGGCGVWASVRKLAERLAEDYEVHIFSTNKVKGSNEIADSSEFYKGIHIHRFKPFLSIGRNINFWNFSKKIIGINPDLIIAEVYRHPHTNSVLKIAKKLKKPVFLVTHAPFVEKEIRGNIGRLIETFYDKTLGKKHLNSFDEIFTITKWELPFLEKIGLKKKPIYLPNGIYEDFFKLKIKSCTPKKILFLGRVSPVKNLEILIKAFSIVKKKNKDLKLEILGPDDKNYGAQLKQITGKLNLSDSIDFNFEIYDLKKELNALQESDICVLPSKREAMPQTLVESLASGKITIASKTQGAKELIANGKNGFLFKISDEKDLAEKIIYCLNNKNLNKVHKIQINARNSVEQYKLNNIAKKFNNLIKKYLK